MGECFGRGNTLYDAASIGNGWIDGAASSVAASSPAAGIIAAENGGLAGVYDSTEELRYHDKLKLEKANCTPLQILTDQTK